MTLTDARSTAPLPSRALGLIAALPPVLIVAGAAALGYTQAPRLEPAISGFFAPPPVAIYHAPQPPIDNTPVAKIAPEPPPPAQQAAEVVTPQPLPVVKHAAKKPVARAPHERVVYVRTAPPEPHYVYQHAPTSPPIRRCQFRSQFRSAATAGGCSGVLAASSVGTKGGRAMSEAEIHNTAGNAARLFRHARRGDGRGERRRLRLSGPRRI